MPPSSSKTVLSITNLAITTLLPPKKLGSLGTRLISAQAGSLVGLPSQTRADMVKLPIEIGLMVKEKPPLGQLSTQTPDLVIA